ncbi:MAG: hypothetical protein HYR84_07330 [Planctomycetes bacterium]|nr:hypothetical protein [Planctomycetota bacterium]
MKRVIVSSPNGRWWSEAERQRGANTCASLALGLGRGCLFALAQGGRLNQTFQTTALNKWANIADVN